MWILYFVDTNGTKLYWSVPDDQGEGHWRRDTYRVIRFDKVQLWRAMYDKGWVLRSPNNGKLSVCVHAELVQ